MDFALDPPFVHVEEEEGIDPRDFLPPSFFSDAANQTRVHFPFVEPPPEHPARSPGVRPLPLRPSGAKSPPAHSNSFAPDPLIPSTSLSRSPSSDTTSTQAESAATDEDPITSPIPITRGLDRPRLHRSTFDTTRDLYRGGGGFRRIPGAISPDDPCNAPPKPEMVCSPGTLRRINALSSDQFRIATQGLGPRRAASARGDLTFMRKGEPSHRPPGEKRNSEKATDRKESLSHDGLKRVETD